MAVASKLGTLRDDTNLIGWAHRVLQIQILRYYRNHYGETRKMSDLDSHQARSASWSPDPVFRETLIGCIARVARSSKRYARVLNLHYQGYTVDEVCEAIGVTRNNYYVILSRARRMLEQCLNENEALP